MACTNCNDEQYNTWQDALSETIDRLAEIPGEIEGLETEQTNLLAYKGQLEENIEACDSAGGPP